MQRYQHKLRANRVGFTERCRRTGFFSYTANSDENIIIYLVRTSGNMDPYLELYDTTGSVAASNYDTSGSSVSLNITGGNYKIAVSDYGKDETGNYAITWINLKNPCNVTTLNCGEAASGALSSAAEFDFYSFDASANEKITIHLVRSSEIWIRIWSFMIVQEQGQHLIIQPP